MHSVKSNLNQASPSLSRRDFLAATLAGTASSLSLPALIQAEFSPRDCRRITIVLTGGASQLDLWDLKPQARREIRGPVHSIATSVPGIVISEHLPGLARLTHQCTFFRGMTENAPEIHDLGGYTPLLNNAIELLPGPASPEFPALAPLSISQFSDRDRFRFGEHSFGRNAWLASQLVRNQSRDVTLHFSSGILNQLSWDMHADGGDLPVSFHDLEHQLSPQLDQGLSGLLLELEETGLLGNTIVSVISEMGRSPLINPRGGRDHFKRAWSNLVAGGRFATGSVIGKTDASASEVVDAPCTPQEFSRLILAGGFLPADGY